MPEACASRVRKSWYVSPESRRTMLRNAALASSVVASMPIVCPLTRSARGQHLQDPRKHGAMGVQIDQAAGARDRRVLGWRFVEAQSQEAAQGQRIGRPPRIPRSESMPSKYPISSKRKYVPGVRLGRPNVAA
jgi:hypothetical protein